MDRLERDARGGFGVLIGRSPAMRQLVAAAEQAAASSLAILISGESGTGKHLLARAIHGVSPVGAGPFIVLDCAAMPLDLLEAELFGRPGRPGALALARGGTLLLDDVSELSRSLQDRLEETLSSGTLPGDPSAPSQPLGVRVIAATRRKLAAEVDREKLSAALCARLSTCVLNVPALRDRREDIPLLAQHLVAQLDEGKGMALSTAALEALSLHDWPGNVRELRNVLERWLYALRTGSSEARRLSQLLIGSDLPVSDRRLNTDSFEPDLSYREQRARFEADFERRYVAWLLERHDGNVSAAARAAEMDRKYLYKLARKHSLKPAT